MKSISLERFPLGPVVWPVLVLIGCVGLLALISPRRFRVLTQGSSRWVDTQKVLSTLDTRVNVDHFVLPFARALGLAVIVAVLVIGYLLHAYCGL
jgi:hypothetical protein